MNVEGVLACEVTGGFYNDDQAAIKQGAVRDGSLYSGAPVTPGFSSIRMPAAAVSIGLTLSDGTVAWGDGMNVQYCGVAGREARLDAPAVVRHVQRHVAPILIGAPVHSFRDIERRLFGPSAPLEQESLSLKYGLSQALLTAVASRGRCSIAEVMSAEYSIPLEARRVPIYCQSGDSRHDAVDKMILRRADILPHGLINNAALVGAGGESLAQYVRWVRDRVHRHGAEGYAPTLHFDVYGCIGDVFAFDPDRIVRYLMQLESIALPYRLQIEAVADFGSLDAQVQGFADLRSRLRREGSRVKLVADEWCNTLADFERFIAADAVDIIQIKTPDMGSVHDTIQGIVRCRNAGVGAYLGGSCTETDLSARLSVQLGVCGQVDMLLAKPGMGVDEGYMTVANEQTRLIAYLESKLGCGFGGA